MTLAERVGLRLKELRTARGLTQARLAEAASMTSDEVSRIERGAREPRFGTLERLAKSLDVPVQALFGSGSAQPVPDAGQSLSSRQKYTFAMDPSVAQNLAGVFTELASLFRERPSPGTRGKGKVSSRRRRSRQ